MGFTDRAKSAAAQEPGSWPSGPQPTPPPPLGSCPEPRFHYATEVNKGSINMRHWQGHLNEMYSRGYRLAHVLEQDGNTVQVFEHHYHL